MKKNLTFFLITTCIHLVIAQVGIGTNKPSANLHVKSDKDYIFTILDGDTKYDSYVLTSYGNSGDIKKDTTSIFKNVKFAELTREKFPPTIVNTSITSFIPKVEGDWYLLNGAAIDLPYGKWAVNITSLITFNNMANLNDVNNTAVTVEVMLIDNLNTRAPFIPSPDVEGNTKNSKNGNGYVSGSIIFPSQKDIVKGIIIINNNNADRKAKRYRFAGRIVLNCDNPVSFSKIQSKGIQGLLHADYLQNQIYAIPLN